MVEIILKPQEKFPSLTTVLFYLALTLLVVSLLTLLSLFYLRGKTLQTIKTLNDILSKSRSAQESLEKEVFPYQKKIDDFALVMAPRANPLGFFSLIEEFSHPKVQFTEVSLSFKLNEFKAGLSGQAESFQALGQQLLLFEKGTGVKDVHLSKIGMRREGGATFALTLTLEPLLFK